MYMRFHKKDKNKIIQKKKKLLDMKRKEFENESKTK